MSENSEILSIKIEYNDTISSTHTFPDSFWIEITSDKTGYSNKLEFDRSNDPLANQPVNMWISNTHSENAFTLHKNTDWDKVRRLHLSKCAPDEYYLTQVKLIDFVFLCAGKMDGLQTGQ